MTVTNLSKVCFKEPVFLAGNLTYEKVVIGTEDGFEWMDLHDNAVRIKIYSTITLVPWTNVEWATERGHND